MDDHVLQLEVVIREGGDEWGRSLEAAIACDEKERQRWVRCRMRMKMVLEMIGMPPRVIGVLALTSPADETFVDVDD